MRFQFMPKNVDCRSVLKIKYKCFEMIGKEMSWQSCVCNKPYHIRGNHKIYREFHLTEKDKGLVQCSPPQNHNVVKYFLQFTKNFHNQFTIISILQIQKKKSWKHCMGISLRFHKIFDLDVTCRFVVPAFYFCMHFSWKKVIRHHLLFNSQYALATTVVHSGRYIIEFIIYVMYLLLFSRVYVFILWQQ